MTGQLASFPTQITSFWNCVVENGGSLTHSGSIGIRIQFQNRVGLNILSDRIVCNYSVGDKIRVKLLDGLIKPGMEVFKVIISGETTGNPIDSVQLAEWEARENDQTTQKYLPIDILLTEDSHIETTDLTVADMTSLPLNPVNGMVRQDLTNGKILRYDNDLGSWREDFKGIYVYRVDTEGTYGADQILDEHTVLLIPPLAKNYSFEGAHRVIWFRNGLIETGGKVYPKGTQLNLEIFVNGATKNSSGVSYSEILSGKIIVELLGVIRKTTGELDTSSLSASLGYQVWTNTASPLVLPVDLAAGYAFAFSAKLAYDTNLMRYQIPMGADIRLVVYNEGSVSHVSPIGHVTGVGIFPEGDRFRIIPDKRLGGSAVLGGGINFYTTSFASEIPLVDFQPDTSDQKVILLAAYNGVPLVKPNTHTLAESENLRAIVSTEHGTATSSPFSSSISLSINSSLTIQTSFSSDIRDDYPDIIAGMTGADFTPPFVKIYLEYNSIDYYEFIFPASLGVNTFTIFNFLSGVSIGSIPDNNANFCCFGYNSINLSENVGSGELPGGNYRIKIAFYYPSPNYFLTTITHDTALGCIPEFKSSIHSAIEAFEGWKPPVNSPTILRDLPLDEVADGDVRLVKSFNRLYRYKSTITGTDDGINIIRPHAVAIGAFIPITTSLPSSGIGSVLVFNGSEYSPLPLGSNDQVLKSNGSTLVWGAASSGGVGTVGPSELHVSKLGQLITVTGDPLELTSIDYPSFLSRGADIYNDGEENIYFLKASKNEYDPPEWRRIIHYTDTAPGIVINDPLSTEPLFSSFPVTSEAADNKYLLSARNGTPPFEWRSIDLASLPDTWGLSYVPTNGDILTFDGAEGLWIPKQLLGSVTLNSLNDTAVASPSHGLSLTWDNTELKWKPALPDLSLVDGVDKSISSIIIPGDDYWNYVAILLTAQEPYIDSSLNGNTTTQSSTLINPISPYSSATNSYEFSSVGKSSISVNTDSTNIIGSNNFCLETWFNPTTLNSGAFYRIVSRGNNTEADFSLDLYEIGSPNHFKVVFKAYLSNGNIFPLTGTSIIAVNNWYHVAITRNGNTWRLFLNGMEEQSKTNSVGLKESFLNPSLLFMSLGTSSGASSIGWTGYIEDFRLTINQARYIANFTPNTASFPRRLTGTVTSTDYSINLSSLADVDIGSPVDGQVISWNDTLAKWVSTTLSPSGSPLSLTLNDLTDVAASSPGDNQLLIFSTALGHWTLIDYPIPDVTSVNGRTGDISITTDEVPQGASNLYFTIGNFNTHFSSKSLEDLGNINITGLTNGQTLVFDGANWINSTTSAPIVSVNGLTGVIDLSTSEIGEGSNLYYTDYRVDSRIEATDLSLLNNVSAATPGDGQVLSYSSATGEWEPSTIDTSPVDSVNGQTGVVSLTTTEIGEGTNLYFTESRVEAKINLTGIQELANISPTPPTNGQVLSYNSTSGEWEPTAAGGAPIDSVNGQTGVVSLTTTDIGEGSNLYFTNSRVEAQISLTSIQELANISTTPPTNGQVLSYNSTNGEWEPTAAGGAPVDSVNGQTGVVSLTTSEIGEGTNLYFTESRVEAKINLTSIQELANISTTPPTNGQVLSYNSTSGEWEPTAAGGAPVDSVNGQTGVVSLTTTEIGEGTNLYFTESRVEAKINLTSIQELANISPTPPTNGQVLSYNSTSGEWEPTAAGGAPVDSVNGQTGVVSLTTTDIGEGSNLYFTNSRVDSRIATLHLNMFADVSTNPVSDGEVLTFNTGIGQWEGRPLTPYQAIVDVTTNYTLSASDHGKYIMCKQPITITLPSSGLPDGFQCVLFNDSTGTITISTAIAFKSKGNLLENLYGAAHLVYNNSTWIALGDLS